MITSATDCRFCSNFSTPDSIVSPFQIFDVEFCGASCCSLPDVANADRRRGFEQATLAKELI